MSATALAITLQNTSFLLAERLPEMVARKASFDQALAFSTLLRRRAIALLLLQGDVEGFVEDLAFSGRAFKHLLQGVREETRATGLQTPFFDAMAAGDLDCAADVARASRRTWNPAEEPEDDFLYMWIVMAVTLDGVGAKAGLDAAARYRELTQDDEEPDARLGVCIALLSGDGAAFDQALRNRMKEVRERHRHLRRTMVITDEAAATEGCLSTEGVSLVRLAGRLGLQTAPDYLLVPSLVWKAILKPGIAERWATELG